MRSSATDSRRVPMSSGQAVRDGMLSRAIEAAKLYRCVLLELATGFGKTRIATALIGKVCDRVKDARVLVLVAKRVHKGEWLREFSKWGGVRTDDVTIECYESLRKHVSERFDLAVLDEGHHLSEARREMLSTMAIGKIAVLSATLPDVLKDWFKERYDTVTLSMGLPSAIRADVLPEPMMWLLGMDFPEGGTRSEVIVKNGGKGLPVVECRWEDRWSYARRKDVEVRVRCTPRQYLDDLESRIAWFRDKVMSGGDWARNSWLRLCKDRLEWLAGLKNPVLRELLRRFDGVRTMTFCASIAQAESLGEHCVHSGNGLSQSILDAFNRGDINHVTAVNILNEGVNVTDCKVGILANVNASDIIVRQRVGRLLRHESPVLVIPYWKGTREEELVKRHVGDYDKKLVRHAASVNDIKL